MNSALEIIAFLDRKQNGYYPVFDTDGRTIAQIQVPWGGRKFTAVATGGATLCTGRPRTFTRNYDVFDAANGLLLTIRSDFWSGKKRTITFGNGAELVLHGAGWPSRDWSVEDAAGRVVLSIAATSSTWSFHPDAYAVQIADPALALAHVVGIVEANRVIVKARRSSAGG